MGTCSRDITATTPEAVAVRVAGLRRSFGHVSALAGVDLIVPAGTVTALLGPNAAGKTTLLRILATLTRPDAGVASVDGCDVAGDPEAVRRRIGLVAHQPLLYPDLSAMDNLRFYGRLYGLPGDEERLRELLTAVGLWHRRHDRVRTFSRGMTQRLAIVRAVLHDPPVLLLDEPHSGLDPSGSRDLDDVLAALAGRGRTVLLASHDLERAHRLADRLAILNAGRVAWEGASAAVARGELPELYAAVTGAPGSRSNKPRTTPEASRDQARSDVALTSGRVQPDSAAAGIARAVASPRGRLSFGDAVRAISWKDLVMELHSREFLPPVAVFGLLVIVLFHFALPVDASTRLEVAPGALWVALLFGSTLGLSRSLGSEVDSGGMTGLLLSPADRGALFLGKWLAGYLFTCLAAAFLLAALVALLALPGSNLLALVGVLLLGLVGWVAAGTLLGALAVSTRAREVLLPVLLYPLVLPLVVPAMHASALALAGSPAAVLAGPLALVAAYDLIFMILGFLFFSLVVEG